MDSDDDEPSHHVYFGQTPGFRKCAERDGNDLGTAQGRDQALRSFETMVDNETSRAIMRADLERAREICQLLDEEENTNQ